MDGASATAVSIPVLARSVGGTYSQDGAIVFRIPGIGHTYTAHVSEDATVFVQSREDVAPSLQCVAVIDAVHLQDDAYRAAHGSKLLAGEISLQWLGTSQYVLAVVHASVAHLLSLRAALQNPYHGHSQHHIVARIAASCDILSLALEPCLSSVYLTSADGVLVCYGAPKQPQAVPDCAVLPWTPSWNEVTPGEHSLLCITSHTRAGHTTSMLASASDAKPSISVWRLASKRSGSAREVSHEQVPVPVPSTAVQFRPHHSADFTPKELCPPEALIAVGQDGNIRLWIDNDAAATLPQPLLAAAVENGATVGPTMCLSQVTSWLVATVYDSAPLPAQPGEDEEISGDQVFVWGVSVLPAAARAPASASNTEDSSSSCVQASCSSPRVTANLWAFDAYKMIWENPRELYFSTGRHGVVMQQAATAATHDGSPVVALAHLVVSATGSHAEIRPSILDLVDLVDTSKSMRDGSALRAVAVHAAAPHQLASATPHMGHVVVHPTLPLAASVSQSGTATLWSTQPMETMHDVTVREEQITAAAWVAHGPMADEAAELATLLTCTPYRLTLQPWRAEQMEAGVDAFAVELQNDAVVEVALPEYLTAAHAFVHTLQVVPCGSCVVVVMHAECGNKQAKLGAVVVHELDSGPVAEGHCEVLPEAAVAQVLAADAVVAVDAAALLMAVAAGAPPCIELYEVGRAGLRLHWKAAAAGASEASKAAQDDLCMYDAHASLACSTAALLHGRAGEPAQLSLFKLVDSGSTVSVEPEQSILVAGTPGAVHVTAVGLGRAAVAVACGRAVTFWFRCTGASWAPGVRASTPGIAHTLLATPAGILAGLKSQMLLLHPSVSAAGGMVSAGGAAEASMQARTLWHPASLLMLLVRGLHDHVADALRMLLLRTRGREQRAEYGGFQERLRQASGSTLLMGMALARVVQHDFPTQPTRAPATLPLHARSGPQRLSPLRPSPPPAAPQSDQHAFNPAAFGAMSAAPAAAVQAPPADPHAFDMSAFGNSLAPQPQQLPPADPMAASVLSMFASATAAPSTAAAAPAPVPPADPVASGMPDLAAFGFSAPQPAAPPKPRSAAEQLASGVPDLAAFGLGPAPSASAASTLDVTSGTSGTPPHHPRATEASTHSSPISNAAQSQDPTHSSSGGAGPVGEGREQAAMAANPMYGAPPGGLSAELASLSSFHDAASGALSAEMPLRVHCSDAACMRTPSFDMGAHAEAAAEYCSRAHARGVCESLLHESAAPRAGPSAASPALDILSVGGGRDPVGDVLHQLDNIEVHAASASCWLTSEEGKELETGLLTGGETARRTRERLQITSAQAHLILRIAALVSGQQGAQAHAAEVAALDLPGRRAVSAACTAAAMLEAAWDEREEADGGSDAPVDLNRGRSKPRMSATTAALLQSLKGGGSAAGGGSSQLGLLGKRSGTAASAGGGGSHFGGSGAFSGPLSGLSGGISSMSGQLPRDEGQPGGAAGVQLVRGSEAAACGEAWASTHITPMLTHTVLHWAFDCSLQKELLEAMMARMPDAERSSAEQYASRNAFSSAGPASRSVWTWTNFRRIGGALWLQQAEHVKAAVERLAKETYAASKNAEPVALWYVAQGKKTVLASLLRSSHGDLVADFLLRDFTQRNQQVAAAKNAHKLATDHRYGLAAAFFLLAGDVDAAMSTCLDKLQDLQLAVMVARVLDAFGKFPTVELSHTDVLFQKLLKQVPESTCPVLHGLLLRAAGKAFTLQAHTAAASAGRCHCMEAHSSLQEPAGGGAAAHLSVGPALGVQAADWLTRTVLCNTSLQHGHASRVAEVAAISGRQAVEVLGWSSAHASLLCEHAGHPLPALQLALRRAAVWQALQLAPIEEEPSLGLAAVRSSVDGGAPARTPCELDRELLMQQSVAMLHCQSALALCGVNSTIWGIPQPEGQPAPGEGARARAGASRTLTSVAVGQHTAQQAALPVPELLFTDGVQLLSSVRCLQGLATAAWHRFEDQQRAQILSDVSAGDALDALQEGGVLLPSDQLGGFLQNACTLLSVHVEAAVIPPPQASEAALGTHRELVRGADGDGVVAEQGLTFAVATVGDKDAQAVSCCVSSLLPLECHLQTVVATKKRGLVFCSTTGSTFCTGIRSCRYTDLHERIVEKWAGNPGMPSGTPRKGMCHPMAYAQHSHRVQMVHPRTDTCAAQALASHPHQATVLSGSAPGYVHAWRYADGTLKATYAPLPLSHQLLEASSGSVPQPSQVMHWSYAMSISYCDSGARFAAIGKGGWVALWRHDAQWANTAHGRIGCCDWTHQCIARRGGAVAFVGSRSTLLMAAGANTDHQDITVWDITVPLSSSRVGVIQTGHHVVDAKVSSDGVTTVTVDRHGDVCGYDMRMLQATISPHVAPGSGRALLWQHEKAHAHGATCVSICPHRLKVLDGSHTLVATGGRDGKVCLWNLQAGTQVQTLAKLHSTANRGIFAFSHSEDRIACKVKGIDFDTVGLVSVGHDDSVLCVPWSSHP